MPPEHGLQGLGWMYRQAAWGARRGKRCVVDGSGPSSCTPPCSAPWRWPCWPWSICCRPRGTSSRWTWRSRGGWGGASMAKPPLWGPGWSAASTMPTADQVIAWGTTLLIVLTGIVDAYRKWRAAHGPPSDEGARLRGENAWLWRELGRLRHPLGGVGWTG